jgi:uncharacterized protein (TIGR02266 family)
MTDARRIHDRVDIDIPVTIVHEGSELSAVGRNISQGGMFIETDAKFDYGAKVKVRFALPTTSDPIEADSTIRWTNFQGIGIQFGSLRAREVWAINQLFKDPDSI